jgi:branched-chain amino acid transport system substrate-binding protein
MIKAISTFRWGKNLQHLAGILVFLGITFAAEPLRAQNSVRIGTFLAVTGQGAFIGAPALATLKLYVDLLNLQGGLLGRKVELIYYDVGIDTRTAQTAIRRLTDLDNVDVIIGGSTTGAAMSVLPIVNQAKLPFIALAGTTALVSPVQKWVFKSSQTDRMACGKILTDMKKRGVRLLGLISGDGGFGRSMRAHCLDIAKAIGMNVIADEIYRTQSRRVVGPLKRIKLKKNIQAVLNVGFGSSPAYVTQNFRKLGFDVPLYQSHGVATQDYLDFSGDAAEGVRLPVPPIIIADKLPNNDPIKPILLSYMRLYKKRWEVDPSVYGTHAFDALRLYASAVRRARSFDREKIRQALERTEGYVGANGIVKMSAKDHMGLDFNAFRMVEIQGGQWVPVD